MFDAATLTLVATDWRSGAAGSLLALCHNLDPIRCLALCGKQQARTTFSPFPNGVGLRRPHLRHRNFKLSTPSFLFCLPYCIPILAVIESLSQMGLEW